MTDVLTPPTDDDTVVNLRKVPPAGADSAPVVEAAAVPAAAAPAPASGAEPAHRPVQAAATADAESRIWPALLALAALLGLGYLLGGVLPGIRAETQTAFWLLGPGALVAGSLRLPALVRFSLVIPVSLAVLVAGGTLLAWTYQLTSRPATALALLVVGATIAGAVGQLAYGVVANRRRPRTATRTQEPVDAGAAVRAAALPLGFALGTIVAWGLALPALRAAEASIFGLLAAGSPWFWAAFAGMLATLVLAVRMPRGPAVDQAMVAARAAALGAAVLVAVVVLRLTPSLAAQVPIYNWTYKHLGIVDLLLRGTATLEGSTDIYLQWPGMFAGAGWLTVQSGLSPIMAAQWITPVITLACALQAAGLLVTSRAVRETSGDGTPRDLLGAAAVAGWLVVVATWVGQDYFAPQAVAIVLAGAILVLLPISRPRRSAAWLIVALFLPLLATHQLTPYWILAVVCALVVLRKAPLWLASMLIIASVGYLLPRMDVIASYGLFTGFSAENVTVATQATSAGQQLTSLSARVCAVLVWLSAGFAWLGIYRRAVNHWRGTGKGRLRSMITGIGSHGALAVMLFAGFAFVLGQSYGGEVILRVYLYSVIPASVLIAVPLTRRLQAAWVGAVTWLLVVTLTAGQAYYGAWFVNKMAPADVQIGGELLGQVQPPAFTRPVIPNWPIRSTANDVQFRGQLWNYDDWLWFSSVAGSDFSSEADFKALEAALTSGAYVPVYLMVSEAMYAWNDYYQTFPPGAMERLTSELLVRPGWQLVRSDGQTMAFQYVGPGWPIGWDSEGRPVVNR